MSINSEGYSLLDTILRFRKDVTWMEGITSLEASHSLFTVYSSPLPLAYFD
jgi:hypothetical protein